MNKEFLRSLGIDESNPKIALEELGKKQIELYEQLNLAQDNGVEEKVRSIEERIRQIEVETASLREEAKNYVQPEPEKLKSEKAERKDDDARRKEAMKALRERQEREARERQEHEERERAKAGQAVGKPQMGDPQLAQSRQPQGNGAQQAGMLHSAGMAKPVGMAQGKLQGAAGAANNAATPQKPDKVIIQAPNGEGEFSKGLRYFQNGDFPNAYQSFLAVAERNPNTQEEVQETAKASYLLADMCRKGIGIKADAKRGAHYLKRAADFGYDAAQVEYGQYILSQHRSVSEDEGKARKEGMKYIEMAANVGCVEGIKEYIKQARKSTDVDKRTIRKAKAFIPVIKEKMDSYEAAQCDNWIKELNDSERAARKKASYPVKYIFGDLLFLLGLAYLIKSMHEELFHEDLIMIGHFIPDIPDALIIKWAKLKEWTEPYFSHEGIFGCWLILLGGLVRALGVKKIENNGLIKLNKFLVFLGCLLITGHFILNVGYAGSFWGMGKHMQFIAVVVSMMIGSFVGGIMYKIIK